MNRRSLLMGAASAGLATVWSGGRSSAGEPAAVATASGYLRGLEMAGIHSFKSVPFAAPPTGHRRLRAPLAHEPWDGVRDATAFGPKPPQPAYPPTVADLLPPEVIPTDPAPIAEAWRAAMTKPADARNRVLVALERNRVVGFAITAPATDPDCDPVADGELIDLTVDPAERGRGHGSRLLQAAADTMAADRFNRAVLWSIATDDALRTFLTSAGWAPDGAHRELDLDGEGTTLVKQVRLHTALS